MAVAQLVRQWRALRLLRQWRAAGELAMRLGVSKSTAQRDIEHLRQVFQLETKRVGSQLIRYRLKDELWL